MARTLAIFALATVLVGAHRAPTPNVFDLDGVGRTVPDLTLTTVDGSPLVLTAPFGRPVLIFLFASWCEPCSLELPWVKEAYAHYGDRVAFIGVDVLDSAANATAFTRSAALPFDVAIVNKATIDAVANDDAREAAGDKYRIPAVYAVDASGVVRGAWHGIPVAADGTALNSLLDYLRRLGIDDGKVAPATSANRRR